MGLSWASMYFGGLLLSMAERRSGEPDPLKTRHCFCLAPCEEMSDFEPVTPGPAFQVWKGRGREERKMEEGQLEGLD